jgi:hypothetical protein
MTKRRLIKSVLAGFIGTYTSRYSDYHGYWLMGQMTVDPGGYVVDLMAVPTTESSVNAFARRLAVQRFQEQLAKCGLDPAVIRSAQLNVRLETEIVEGLHGDYPSEGHLIEFVASAVLDTGRQYECKRKVFVAPHDPQKETRRLPAAWGI